MENRVPRGKRAQDFYAHAAKAIVKDARTQRQVSYKNLARLLEANGTHVDVQVLINRVNQGAFSFAFALELLAAMGVEHLEVPRMQGLTARTGETPQSPRPEPPETPSP
ncbi:MAG: hypothetical protein JNK17_17655 [Hydrogenophaga sp.]|nr:hypothetical protein [Hydrogenophaga sp.]